MTQAEQKTMEKMQGIEMELLRGKMKKELEAFETLVNKFKTNDIRKKTTW